MKPQIKSDLKLFLTALAQVGLTAVNMYQVSHSKWIGAIVVGFFISWLWTNNVNKVAFGFFRNRVIYASGAAIGTGIGMLISHMIYTFVT